MNQEGKWKWYMYNNDFIYLCPKFITSSPTVQKSVLHTQIWTILVFAWKIFQWEARRCTYTWWNKILACSSMFRSWWCQWYTIKSKINKPSYKWTPQNLAVGRDKVWLWDTHPTYVGLCWGLVCWGVFLMVTVPLFSMGLSGNLISNFWPPHSAP